ncbi:MAG: DJ-1/PfpI family protein [Bifidobacteriaceae bacterium]|jgi:putative intracellular protease/amidase|nr:DJ-1/PfpI family protein [Bifidobacteriaceae bacterium]
MPAESRTHQIGVMLFDGFDLLDVCGPLEVFAVAPGRFDVTLIGPAAGPVTSAAGIRVIADVSYADAAMSDAGAPPLDVALVPGGPGTRTLAGDPASSAWLRRWASGARLAASVCTGAALLAAAGLLNGYRATSNRRAFDWVRQHGERVTWVDGVRWVEDRDRWTSAGVSAGIDMTLALVGSFHGDAAAREAAARMEYAWNRP